MKKLLLLITLSLFLMSCNSSIDKKSDKIKIVSTVIPVASITSYIGGDEIDSISLISAGKEPHDYDLSVQNLVDVNDSRVVLSIGQDSIDGYIKKAENKKNIVELSKLATIGGILNTPEQKIQNLQKDPHIWMSPQNSLEIANFVKDFLVGIDTKNNTIYRKNYDLYEKEINTLISDFKKYKDGKKQKSFIVFHDAYDYLFDDLGIDKSKKIVFREAVLKDPDSKHMASLIDSIEKGGVKIIYKEPLFTSPSFENLITKYDLTVGNLDADGTDPSKNGYINQLKSNIEQLKKLYE